MPKNLQKQTKKQPPEKFFSTEINQVQRTTTSLAVNKEEQTYWKKIYLIDQSHEEQKTLEEDPLNWPDVPDTLIDRRRSTRLTIELEEDLTLDWPAGQSKQTANVTKRAPLPYKCTKYTSNLQSVIVTQELHLQLKFFSKQRRSSSLDGWRHRIYCRKRFLIYIYG